MTTKRQILVTLCLALASVFGVAQAQNTIYSNDFSSQGKMDECTLTDGVSWDNGKQCLKFTRPDDFEYDGVYVLLPALAEGAKDLEIAVTTNDFGFELSLFTSPDGFEYTLQNNFSRYSTYSTQALPNGTRFVKLVNNYSVMDAELHKVEIKEMQLTWDIAAYSHENVTATLNRETGKLTVSGIGTMKHFLNYVSTPWCNDNNNHREITQLEIQEGVTSIGNYAFIYCENLLSANIAESVTDIGYSAFENCSRLADINIPSSFRQDS